MDQILSPRSVTRTKQKSKGRRKFPISHLGEDLLMCNKCSQLSAKFTIPNPSFDGDHLMSDDDEKTNRAIVFNEISDDELVGQMSLGKFWKSSMTGWCDKCKDTLNENKPTIAQLFGVLRQWTPQAQLQLATIVQEFFRCGANVNDRDCVTDMTLLHYVAKCGALGDEEIAAQIAELLLKHGAEIESRCSWSDMTPLHFAAYFDCPLMVQLLLDHNANLLARSSYHDGSTALHLAASNLSLAAAKVILQSESLKPEIELRDIKDNLGRTPNDCLPPEGQLPEPLSNIRDRLMELLKYKTSHRQPLCSEPNFDHFEDEFKKFSIRCEKDNDLGDHDKLNTIPRINKAHKNSNEGVNELNDKFANTFDQILNPNYVPPPVVYIHTPGTAETGTLVARTRRSSSVAPVQADKTSKPPMTMFVDDVDENIFTTSQFSQDKETKTPVKLENPTDPTKPNRRATKSVTPDLRSRSRGRLIHPGKAQQQSVVSAKVTLQSLGLNIGDKVCVGPASASVDKQSENNSIGINGRLGSLKYCGPVEFAAGIWVGVQLDEPLGRNNGSVSGVTYFQCKPKYGIFAPIGRVYKLDKNSCWHSIGTPTINSGSERNSICDQATKNDPIDVSHVTAKIDTGLKRKPFTSCTDANQDTTISIGDSVLVASLRKGIVRFIGETEFAPGIWYGIELRKPFGKNDGSVGGVNYFSCPKNHGIFSPLKRIRKINGDVDDNTDEENSSSCNGKMTQSYHETMSDNENSSIDRRSQRKERANRCNSAINSPQPQLASLRLARKKFILEKDMNVLCAGEMGTLKYIGPVSFTDGVWLGIELRKPCGRHDGLVNDKRYFSCKPNHGVLVRPSRVSCRGISASLLLPPEMMDFEKKD